MAYKTKIGYAEAVLLELQESLRNRDEQVDKREVIIRMDAIVNQMAKEGVLENWKLGFGYQTDEQYLTRWEWLTVTDPTDKSPSYIAIPANYVALAKNGGINQVYFQNDFTSAKKKYFDPVIITTYQEVSLYRSNMAGKLEGRISCYPRNGNLYFDRGNINKIYGNIGMALVVRDSSSIADDQPYPIPADKEHLIIANLVQWFRSRRAQPQDLIRDNNDITTATGNVRGG